MSYTEQVNQSWLRTLEHSNKDDVEGNRRVIYLLETETGLLNDAGVSDEEIRVLCEKYGLKEEQVRCCLMMYVLLVVW